MKILICSILRNQEHHIYDWYYHLKKIVLENKNIKFYLSCYENNSFDQTKEILNNLDFYFFEEKKIISEDIQNIPYFKGGYEPYGEESKRRVEILSTCRNKCFNFFSHNDFSYVLFIEPDIKYDTNIFKNILNFITVNDYDVVSAISYCGGQHYDKWGTRLKPKDTWCDLTHVLGTETKIDLYSTFNCFVMYKAKPIFEFGCKFGFYSEILSSHDCDTVVICENFRKEGYNKICVLPNNIVSHFF